MRRNPTDAERILWQALTKDRRFAGQFKRQTPVGRHIPDFVSFVHRIAIELENADESETIVADRAARKAWLEARDYRVVNMRVADVEGDLASELERLDANMLTGSGSPSPATAWRRPGPIISSALSKGVGYRGAVIGLAFAMRPGGFRPDDNSDLHRHQLLGCAARPLRLLHLRRSKQIARGKPRRVGDAGIARDHRRDDGAVDQ